MRLFSIRERRLPGRLELSNVFINDRLVFGSPNAQAAVFGHRAYPCKRDAAQELLEALGVARLDLDEETRVGFAEQYLPVFGDVVGPWNVSETCLDAQTAREVIKDLGESW